MEFDNNKFNQTITNIQLSDACIDRWSGLRENHILMIKIVIKYIIAILLESKLVDNKEQARLEMPYNFDQEDLMKEIDSYSITENKSINRIEWEIIISKLVYYRWKGALPLVPQPLHGLMNNTKNPS